MTKSKKKNSGIDTGDANKYGSQIFEKFAQATGLAVAKSRVLVEREGQESENFWDLFDLG